MDAQFDYALLLDEGAVIPADTNLAAFYYKFAAQAGILQAQLRLAELYAGQQGVAKDSEAAFGWLLAAAEQGDASASYRVADAYLTGNGVKASRQQARFWFETAAAADYEDAAWRLVQLLDKPENNATSTAENGYNAYPDYLKIAADKNNADAALMYAQLVLEKGISDASISVAMPYLEQAVTAEIPAAMFEMAALLSDDSLVSHAPERSLELYEQAARAGYLEAQLLLGEVYGNPDTAIYDPQRAFGFILLPPSKTIPKLCISKLICC